MFWVKFALHSLLFSRRNTKLNISQHFDFVLFHIFLCIIFGMVCPCSLKEIELLPAHHWQKMLFLVLHHAGCTVLQLCINDNNGANIDSANNNNNATTALQQLHCNNHIATTVLETGVVPDSGLHYFALTALVNDPIDCNDVLELLMQMQCLH